MKIKTRFKARDTVDKPVACSLAIFSGWTSRHCFAPTLLHKPFNARNDHSRVGHEKVICPLHDRIVVAFARVAVAMGQTLTEVDRLLFGLLLRDPLIDARAPRVSGIHIGVDGLVAQPTSPAILFTNFINRAHALKLQPHMASLLLARIVPMRLLVRNMSRKTTQEELQDLFESFGAVQSCVIVSDEQTGQSKGFGFVDMPKSGEAKAAVHHLNGYEVNGERIRVKRAK